jgi:hypothetical protein
MSKRTLKDKFTDMAEEVLTQDGPMMAISVAERVQSMAKRRDIAVRDLSNITTSQVGTILKQDKRFKRVRAEGFVRIGLWTVRSLETE